MMGAWIAQIKLFAFHVILAITYFNTIPPPIPVSLAPITALTVKSMELAVWYVQAALQGVSELYLQVEPVIAILVTSMTTAR